MPPIVVRATFEPTRGEAVAMMLASARTPRGGALWALRALAVMVFEAMIVLFVHALRAHGKPLEVVYAAYFGAVPIVWFFVPLWTYVFGDAEVASRKTGTRIELDDESITVVNGGIRRRFRWRAIRRADEREDAVVLSTDNEAIWLPRRCAQLRPELSTIIERVDAAHRDAPVITRAPMRIESYRDASQEPSDIAVPCDDFAAPQPPAAARIRAFVHPSRMDVRSAMYALFRGHIGFALLAALGCLTTLAITPRRGADEFGWASVGAVAVALTSAASYVIAIVFAPTTDALRQLTATGAEVAIGAFGLYQRTSRNEQTYAWSAVVASIETSSAFVLMTWSLHVIPKCDLDDAQSGILSRTLVDMLGERHQAHNK